MENLISRNWLKKCPETPSKMVTSVPELLPARKNTTGSRNTRNLSRININKENGPIIQRLVYRPFKSVMAGSSPPGVAKFILGINMTEERKMAPPDHKIYKIGFSFGTGISKPKPRMEGIQDHGEMEGPFNDIHEEFCHRELKEAIRNQMK